MKKTKSLMSTFFEIEKKKFTKIETGLYYNDMWYYLLEKVNILTNTQVYKSDPLQLVNAQSTIEHAF
jgi:hypothetical protein